MANQVVIKEKTIKIFMDMQNRVQALTRSFFLEHRRYYYVTPTSYLELLKLFKKMYQERTEFTKSQIRIFEAGLQKLIETDLEVKEMQRKLELLQPILVEKNRQNDVLLQKLVISQTEVVSATIVTEGEPQEAHLRGGREAVQPAEPGGLGAEGAVRGRAGARDAAAGRGREGPGEDQAGGHHAHQVLHLAAT